MRLETLRQTPLPWATPTPLPPGATPFFDTTLLEDGSNLLVNAMENGVQIYNSLQQGGLADAIMTGVIVLLVLGGFYLIYYLITHLDSDE